jgi:hypothetical protein
MARNQKAPAPQPPDNRKKKVLRRPRRVSAIKSEVTVAGRPVYIEISEIDLPQDALVTMADISPEQLIGRLEAAGEAAGAACVQLFNKMNGALQGPGRPETITVEFGVSLGGEIGVPFVAKGKGDATFKVCAEWRLSGSPK